MRRKRKAARRRCSVPRRAYRTRRCACPTCRTGQPMDRLNFEAEAIGFHLTAHPLDAYAKALRRLGTTPCMHVETAAQSGVTRIRLAGVVGAQKERVTRTGNRMAWVRITDASGSCEVTLFSEVLGACAICWSAAPAYWSPRIFARTPKLCGSPRKTYRHSTRRRLMPVPRCASGCMRRHRCRTSAICSGARGVARAG